MKQLLILKIGPVVSLIGGGLILAPLPSGARYRSTPVGRGLNHVNKISNLMLMVYIAK